MATRSAERAAQHTHDEDVAAARWGSRLAGPGRRGTGAVGLRLAQQLIEADAVEPSLRRALLVADRGLFRLGLGRILAQAGFASAGETATAAEALSLVSTRAPDVVLVDLSLTASPAIELLRSLRAAAPGLPLVALVPSESECVVDAIAAGANGYAVRGDSAAAIVDRVVRATLSSDMVVSTALISRVAATRRPPHAPPELADESRRLSQREVEVLRLIVDGRDNNAIARELYLSAETIKCHVSRILAKLGVRNRVQAAVEAVRRGLV